MSRPKSQATLDLERDRAIRRERRELKRAEKERRRAEREARLAKHEEAKKGIAAIVADNGEPRYAAMRNYFPWAFCEVGHHPVRENLMHDDTVCIDCAEGGPIKAHVTERKAEQGPLFAEGREA